MGGVAGPLAHRRVRPPLSSTAASPGADSLAGTRANLNPSPHQARFHPADRLG